MTRHYKLHSPIYITMLLLFLYIQTKYFNWLHQKPYYSLLLRRNTLRKV